MKKNIIIIILSIMVLGLGGYLVYDKVFASPNETEKTNDETPKKDQDDTEQTFYKEYHMKDTITLKDGSKWIAIEDSDKNQDYVTLISTYDYANDVTDEDYQNLMNALFINENKTYDDSYVKEYIENKIYSKINVKLKKIDEHDIRLITVEEIENMYPGWEYNADTDSYTYMGNESHEEAFKNLFMVLTMSQTKCSEGKCPSFYVTTSNPDQYYIEHWASGIGGLKPVIQVYKSEIVD